MLMSGEWGVLDKLCPAYWACTEFRSSSGIAEPDDGGTAPPTRDLSPLVVVADHPEAAHDAIVTEHAPVVGTGHNAIGVAVGTHGGDRTAVVTAKAAEDLDSLPAVIENAEAGGARSAGRCDAALSGGGVRTFVEVDPSLFLMAVAVAASAALTVAALVLLSACAAAARGPQRQERLVGQAGPPDGRIRPPGGQTGTPGWIRRSRRR